MRSWRAERVKTSQPGDVGLCALLACAYFGFCAKTDARNKTLKHQSNKTNNFSEDLTRCTLGFEQALFCCCLGGLPLCGQWRVGKHGEACQRKRWCRITGIPLKMNQQSEVCELHSKKKKQNIPKDNSSQPSTDLLDLDCQFAQVLCHSHLGCLVPQWVEVNSCTLSLGSCGDINPCKNGPGDLSMPWFRTTCRASTSHRQRPQDIFFFETNCDFESQQKSFTSI